MIHALKVTEAEMDVDVSALVSTAATTLVGLLATDAWKRAKAGIDRIWSKAEPDAVEVIEAEVVRSRTELLAAAETQDQALVDDHVGAWRIRLRRLIADHPEAAGALQLLTEELSSPASVTTSQTAVADHGSTVWQAGRDITNRSGPLPPPPA